MTWIKTLILLVAAMAAKAFAADPQANPFAKGRPLDQAQGSDDTFVTLSR